MIVTPAAGTLTGSAPAAEDIRMSMDADATPFLMAAISSDLYLDGHRATLRELTANALDSHLRAGQTRPVEVTLPTALNPNLTVQDFGVGMSVDDIRRTYSKFGASDKRSSNAERGGFGLGSKSGLSITSQFTFIAVKDGQRATVLASRGADGIPVMKVLTIEDTADANGVTVIVPVSKPDEMQKHVPNLFATVPPHLLLVDGKPPALSVHDDTEWMRIGDAGWWARDGVPEERLLRRGLSVDLMGAHYAPPKNVELGRELPLGRMVLSIPNGSVKVTASRDSLLPTPANAERIADAVDGFLTALHAHLDGALAAATTHAEALTIALDAPKGYTPTWRGDEVPAGDFDLPAGSYRVGQDRETSGQVETHRLRVKARYVYAAPGKSEALINAARKVRAVDEWEPTIIGTVAYAGLNPWLRSSLTELDATELTDRARELCTDPSPTPRARKSTAADDRGRKVKVVHPSLATQEVLVSELGDRVCFIRNGRAAGFAAWIEVQMRSGYGWRVAAPVLDVLAEAGWKLVKLRSNEIPERVSPHIRDAADVLDELFDDIADRFDEYRTEYLLRRHPQHETAVSLFREHGIGAADLDDPRWRVAVARPDWSKPAVALEALSKAPDWSYMGITPTYARVRDLLLADRKAKPLPYKIPLAPATEWDVRNRHVSAKHIAWYVNAVYRDWLAQQNTLEEAA